MAPILSITHASVRRRDGQRELVVLDDISLDLYGGETCAVWGTRRSGKTTLANLAAGLIASDRGSVSFEGHELRGPTRLHPQTLNRGIALVHCGQPQGPRGRTTVFDHVYHRALRKHGVRLYQKGARRSCKRETLLMLDQLGMTAYAKERWENLSYLDRAVVAIAEALIPMPRLLILDDFDLIDAREHKWPALLREIVAISNLSILLTTGSVAGLSGMHRLASLTDGQLVTSEHYGGEVVPFRAKQRLA
jgi:ABC-type molybdenum transport system ATPase subunit/photorepair protein PhrA